MNDKLLPCPFCGEEANYILDPHFDDKHVITCDYCGCERRDEYSVDGVIEEWNTRHMTAADVPDSVRREVAQLQARVAELEAWIIEEEEEFCGGISKEASAVLNRTPAQSLATIRAQTLRDAGQRRLADAERIPLGLEHKGRGPSVYNWERYFASELIEEADAIEKDSGLGV